VVTWSHIAITICRQQESVLFCRLDCVQSLQKQLDNAVGLERRQSDDLASSSQNNPKRRVLQKFHKKGIDLQKFYLNRPVLPSSIVNLFSWSSSFP
jgi:hypothetical protein